VDLYAFGMAAMMLLWAQSLQVERVQTIEEKQGRQEAEKKDKDRLLREAAERAVTDLKAILPGFEASKEGPITIAKFPSATQAGEKLFSETAMKGADEVLFARGAFDLSPDQEGRIASLGRVLNNCGYFVADERRKLIIRGEADLDPYRMERTGGRPSPPRNNHELSALRAATVSRLLAEEGGISKGVIEVVGLGEQGQSLERGSSEPLELFEQRRNAAYQEHRRVTLEIRIDLTPKDAIRP
jgi:flagellar motor protein MotB